MSGKVENEIEEKEEEREMIDHWVHEHPLAQVEIDKLRFCYGCGGYFRSGDKAYGCSRGCGYKVLLHEDCAEAPMKIRHAMHPQHTLTQQLNRVGMEGRCSICKSYAYHISYRCTSAECTFETHVRCAQGSDMIFASEDEQSSSIIHHPSHPKHQLLFRRRSSSFKCDACGTTGDKGSSYTCTTPECQYWIHERCASLPQIIQRDDHHHSLTLSFHVPHQYLRHYFHCEVCRKSLISKHWIYHCQLCRYVVHLSCAFIKLLPTTREKGIIEFPIKDVSEDLIGAFLRRQGVDTNSLILDHQDDVDYEFHHHKLRLVSSSFQEEVEDENSDDDDEEDYSCRKSELICNGCITPILVKHETSPSSSSSSGSKDYYYYMRCSIKSCKYYLHTACFQLPPQLSSLPHLHERDHNLLLHSGDKLKPWKLSYCEVCDIRTNGLFYECTKCDFRLDIKCASMPDTIYHAAHPHHSLNLLPAPNRRSLGYYYLCDACQYYISGNRSFKCGSCDFIVHLDCVRLPASTTSRRWDKHHPLPLTHNAILNHPGDFYCNQCEYEINPKRWMYHCRDCDLSFHPECFKTTSGDYMNIKFGQKYVSAGVHCHTLTFQILTTKRRCDFCRQDRHEYIGFFCASCNFFICLGCSSGKMIEDGNSEAVD